MKKKKTGVAITVLALLLACGFLLRHYQQEASLTSRAIVYGLSPESLAHQVQLANDGDNVAARRVAYHHMAQHEYDKSIPWQLMYAERGSLGDKVQVLDHIGRAVACARQTYPEVEGSATKWIAKEPAKTLVDALSRFREACAAKKE